MVEEMAIEAKGLYDYDSVRSRIEARGLVPGQRLWAAGDVIDANAVRMGNSPANAAIYLRGSDLGIKDPAKKGKVVGGDLDSLVVNPGQGLSMFIERTVHQDFNHIETRTSNTGKAALRALAEEKGYASTTQIHWFKLEEGRQMPAGLEVVFDNQPPGHCILTVTHSMPVREFLNVVNSHLAFDYIGTDIFGKR